MIFAWLPSAARPRIHRDECSTSKVRTALGTNPSGQIDIMTHWASLWPTKDDRSSGSITSPTTCRPGALAITRRSSPRSSRGSFAKMTRMGGMADLPLRRYRPPTTFLHHKGHWPLAIHSRDYCFILRIAETRVHVYVSRYRKGIHLWIQWDENKGGESTIGSRYLDMLNV